MISSSTVCDETAITVAHGTVKYAVYIPLLLLFTLTIREVVFSLWMPFLGSRSARGYATELSVFVAVALPPRSI